MLPRHLLLLALGAVACAKERPLAPTEMTDIVRYMFANWEDEPSLEAAVDNLDPWLTENAATDEADEGYRLDPLAEADVDSVERPDANLGDLLGAAGGAVSAFGIDAQAGHIVAADQVWANPSQYKRYDRSFAEGTPSGFKQGTTLLRTVNQVETSTLGVSIPYVLLKDYRWIEGENATAIVARSWIEDASCSDSGKNCLIQSFSVDVFQAAGRETLRLTATWSEVESSVNLSDDLLVASLAKGLQNVFDATDEYLAE